MTRPELAAACASVASGEAFDARFRVFVGLGLLQRPRGKAYEGRYVFNPTSGAALLVFERREAGGVEEIMTMLGRTHDSLQQGLLDEASGSQVCAAIVRSTGHLLRWFIHQRRVGGQRHHHRSKRCCWAAAQRLVERSAAISRD
ncbi:hypothetical protein [Streptomyces sp. NBC_00658]|uniref:hypothetical protein n=1 Tax=Streptomyces sp. NBC_00658 TaxID=2975800 RepID=UPI00324FD05D